MKHVIIGNGPAGFTAAETIRSNAEEDDILLIGNEAEAPYSRAALPDLLAGHIQEPDVFLRPRKGDFGQLNIRQKRARVIRIDGIHRKVITEDGATLDFDRLLIATGASPAVPLIPGIDSPGVHHCWTLADARRIMQLARPSSRVVLIGAGFIGCLLMQALAARGVYLSVVEKRDHMVPNMMGEAAGRIIQEWCERKGIHVYTSRRVDRVEAPLQAGKGRPLRACLSSGEVLHADLIVYATGVKANIGFLPGSGIKCGQGIHVDACMQTNIPGIYAAGDCAETVDPATGRGTIAGVYSNAADQAYCAALNMTGRKAWQQGPRQVHLLDTFGLVSSSHGQWKGVSGGQWVELSDARNFQYLRLEFKQDVLVGSSSIGLHQHAGILQDLIQHRVALGEWKERLLRDPTRLREAHAACVRQRSSSMQH